MRRALRGTVLLAGVVLCHRAHAQTHTPPVFRTSVEAVRLDVRVTDAHGEPIADLSPADFEVRQDGKLRSLIGFEVPRPVPAAPEGPGPGAASSDPPPHDAAAARTSQRTGLLAVVVDDRHMKVDSVFRAKEGLKAALATTLASFQQVAIVSTTEPAEQPLLFDSNPDRQRERIERLRWDLTTIDPPRVAPPARCESTIDIRTALEPVGSGLLATLVSSIAELGRYPGRKTLVVIADSVGNDCPRDQAQLVERLRTITDLASRREIVIHGLQALGFRSDVMMPERRGNGLVEGPLHVAPPRNLVGDTFLRLAEDTGGAAARRSDIAEMLGQVLRDHDRYYVLLYEPPAGTFEARKARYHHVEVTVKRPGARVQTRRGFYGVTDDDLAIR